MTKTNNPKIVDEYLEEGNKLFSEGNASEAVGCFEKALEIEPENPLILSNLGTALFDSGNNFRAIEMFQKSLSIHPNYVNANYNMGILLQRLGRENEAIYYFQKTIEIYPTLTIAYNDLAICLKVTGKYDQAIEVFKKAITLDPAIPHLYNNLGNALRVAVRYKEAVLYYKIALCLDPNFTEAWGNLGAIYRLLGDFKKAESHLLRAIELDPKQRDCYYNLAAVYQDQQQFKKSINNLQEAIRIDPNFKEATKCLFLVTRQICDWKEYKKTVKKLDELGADDAYTSVVRIEDPAKNYLASRKYSSTMENLIPRVEYKYAHKDEKNRKIRIGYFSNDMRKHPIGQMVAAMFRYHNRSKFEVSAYSYGIDDETIYRQMVIEGVDSFVDLKDVSDKEAAEKINRDGIDILIDITGFTQGNRLEIIYNRPAPIQVTYLGFPGTSGASFFDYVVADKMVAPMSDAKYFSEKIAYLPHAYQVNNDSIEISHIKYKRSDFGLPEKAFVFVSFNQSYKIDPTTWKVWMEILKGVPKSVLWLWEQDRDASENLRNEAKKLGIDPKRLIFSVGLPKEEHLARVRLADLGLDTRVYGGHTTTSDFLRAGVPVLTVLGKHFASRVCASLLYEVGLPEMVVKSLEEYKKLAIKLAKSPAQLTKLRKRITRQKLFATLYNTKRTVANLEKLYEKMWEIYKKGENPDKLKWRKQNENRFYQFNPT